MDLTRTIKEARRNGANLYQVHLILALLELKATETPMFAGLENEELVIAILDLLRVKEQEYYDFCVTGDVPNGFLGFLSKCDCLDLKVNELYLVLADIRSKGEENYEFKNIARLDPDNTRGTKAPGTGQARRA